MTRHAVTSAAVGAALLVAGLFGGQQLDARTVNEAASILDPLELQVELARHTGRFAWPVSYGVPDPTEPGFQHARGGINIPAELGDPVVAVENGRVIDSAQSVRGMGHLIVVEHADGLQSVYANNQYNYVQEGDTVARGQLIADVGALFNTGEAGLYFELREAGKTRDPLSDFPHWGNAAGTPNLAANR